MTREEAIKYIEQHAYIDDEVKDMCVEALGNDTNVGSRREWYQKGYQDGLNANKWIPFECREADEEEKEAYGWEEVLCCKLPDEDEEILVSYASGYVDTDIFLRDGTECYLESGAEFVTEAVAWQPLPQPYKGE